MLAMSAMILFAASCAKEELSEESQSFYPGVERTISVEAGLPQSGDKAFLSVNDELKVKWDPTDQISINGTALTLDLLSNDATQATFYGTAHAISNGGNDVYWGVYPTSLAPAYSGGIPSQFSASQLKVTFPAIQSVVYGRQALDGYAYMAGYANTESGAARVTMQMRNLGAVLKLHLEPSSTDEGRNTKVEKIELTSSNQDLAGQFVVSDDPDNPTITPGTSTSKTLVVELKTGNNKYIDIARGCDVYVIVPPMTSKNLNLKIYNTDGYYCEKKASSVSMHRAMVYTTNLTDITFTTPSHVISVSPTRKVIFAQGNLRYQASTSTWQIAAHQWDFIGSAPGNITDSASRRRQSDTIDLFGWGTSGWSGGIKAYQPWRCDRNSYMKNGTRVYYYWVNNDSANNLTGNYANADWGIHNNIYNLHTQATDNKGYWRTPTADEWKYALNERTTSSGIRYVKAQIKKSSKYYHGLLILPDDWSTATYSLNGPNDSTTYYSVNTITAANWNNILEPAGCVFLPASMDREFTTVDTNSYGDYWSSTACNRTTAYQLYFGANHNEGGHNGVQAKVAFGRHKGRAVRMVHVVSE